LSKFTSDEKIETAMFNYHSYDNGDVDSSKLLICYTVLMLRPSYKSISVVHVCSY